MTRFEAEQLYDFIDQVETALEEWTLSRYQMQSMKGELTHLSSKLNREIAGITQLSRKNILLELSNRIQDCQICIDERLRY